MRALAFALALAAVSVAAQAHPMPHSTVVVRSDASEVELVASIPVSELKAATDEAPAAEAGGYLAKHAAVTGSDGRAWAPVVREVEADALDGYAVMTVRLGFSPPAGGAPRAAVLRYDAVTHRIASHYVLVYRRTADGVAPLVRLQAPTISVGLP